MWWILVKVSVIYDTHLMIFRQNILTSKKYIVQKIVDQTSVNPQISM